MKTLSSVLVAASMLAAPLPAAAQSGASPPPALSPAPLPIKRCINLGGTLERKAEGLYGNTVLDREDIRRVAAAGFDTIRLPVRWDTRSSAEPPHKVDPEWMARVAEVVDWALAENLNVVLDSHHFADLFTRPRTRAPVHAAIWAQIATRFADYPEDRLFFELENEPYGNGETESVLHILEGSLAAVRQSNPTRPVIMGGGGYGSLTAMVTMDLPDDPHVYPTFHYYAPAPFTHQGARWAGQDAPAQLRTFGSEEDRAALRRAGEAVEAYIRRTGHRPFLGETGTYKLYTPLGQRVEYLAAVYDTFAPLGVSVCAWSYEGPFGMYDTQNGEWYPGMLEAMDLPPR